MIRWFVCSLLPALAGSLLLAAEPVTVRIQAPSDQASRALLEKLNEEGGKSGLHFELRTQNAQVEIVVDWTSNWGTMAPPQATVAVSGRGIPSFSVQRTAPFRKSWAMEACAGEIVRRIASARLKQEVQ